MLKEKLYKICIALIFIIGIALRTYLYLKNQTLWYDEAALAENILKKSYIELFKGLSIMQATPAFFTTIVKAFYNICQPQNAVTRDLVLRFIPFVSGILILPAFYYLSKLVFENHKKYILTSLALISFNPCAIIYATQLKQYSTETLFAIILLIIFYNMVILNKYKWKYAVIIAISPWFSYSSFFIIASGFFSIIFKNWKKCILYFLPVLLSSLIYYFISLKFVFAANYSGMNDFWSHGYAFMEFSHPLRLLIRIGELYTTWKYFAILVGGIIIFAIINFTIQTKDLSKKGLFILPFILTLIASSLHKYPFCARLILFLLPTLIITIVSIKGKTGKILSQIFVLITAFSITNYQNYDIIKYSYARETIKYLVNNLNSNDVIIIDSDFTDYDFYLRDYNIKNKIIRVPKICSEKTTDSCLDYINKLPSAQYYFLSYSTYMDEVIEKSDVEVKNLDLGFKPKKTKVFHFEKEN